MSYEVILHTKATKTFKKLDKGLRDKIKKKIKALKTDPYKVGKHLRYVDYWGLRIGVYRIIYYIDEEKKRVGVVVIGHKKSVYDDFSKLF